MNNNQPPTTESQRHDQPRLRPRKAEIRALIVLLLLVNLAASLYQLPLNRVIERRLCREYYNENDRSVVGRDGSVAEELCKVDEVQRGLASIQGVLETAWIAGDFIVVIPLGFMTEKYGQRAILWLNLVPRIFMLSWGVVVGYFEQSLPVNALVAGPILSLLGGDCVFNSITYSLAAAITDDYVLRAIYFGWMSSVTYAVALTGPALASASMTILLWLPFWISIVLLLLAIPTIFMLPGPSATEISHSPTSLDEHRPLISSPVLKAQGSDPSLWTSMIKRMQTLHFILMSHPRNLTLLSISFFLTSLGSSDTKLLAQYISKRYPGWTFASAGYLLSGKAVVNFALLTVIIPRLLRAKHASRLPGSHTTSSDRANLLYARICLLVSVVGALAIALAGEIWLLVPSLFIYALGSALPIFTLSLLKSPAVTPKDEDRPVDRSDPETLILSMVMMVKTLGSLLGSPLMALLWIRGIRIGGAALGMPYFVSSVCYAMAVIVLSGIRVSRISSIVPRTLVRQAR